MGTKLQTFRRALEEDYRQRFPNSWRHYRERARSVLDGTSHAIRWSEPFMPVARRAEGPAFEDLDGHRILDYWQGHFANLHGHNPPFLREAMERTLREGRGLQTGLVHEVEAEVCERIAACAGAETVRLTTSGSLATFYAVLLARAFTGRSLVVKVSGGWHGSQPFGLKGVRPREGSFDHLESEGLGAEVGRDVLLTRFNDPEDLARIFRRHGDGIACFLVEPVLGAGGGFAARSDYLREARRLTAHYGALLLCDEIITGFRFRAGDCTRLYGVVPDLWILGKILGGGMPVAAVAGRRQVLALCTRECGRVKFEGGTYSAHELSLVAAREQLRHVMEHEGEIYPRLGALGRRMRQGLARVSREIGVPLFLLGDDPDVLPQSSLVLAHPAREANLPAPSCPEELLERRHPEIGERLLKSVLMLEGVSTRSGLGAISTAHTEADLDETLRRYARALERLREAFGS